MFLELGNGTTEDLTSRVIDLVSPIGKGQRGLIVSPPKAGKTMIMQNLAHSIAENNPESYLPDGNQDLSVKPPLIHLLHAYNHSFHNIC